MGNRDRRYQTFPRQSHQITYLARLLKRIPVSSVWKTDTKQLNCRYWNVIRDKTVLGRCTSIARRPISFPISKLEARYIKMPYKRCLVAFQWSLVNLILDKNI
ncbi:unnamed protein product [Kuraishia capsulata CBS 1993]|uniref:Uncharacterized protein n=1 Tax=Kuraishia capsulata CBS 1993 TaxID=1382522 RepID=W6MSY8_9ASCO|nr:uncharacterized protein KUCA_T00000852001 [Kuraishia capsulata CBS 1993]CDK24885.1 unnamed protein product [Kuraishia capsulata CBS 1993]